MSTLSAQRIKELERQMEQAVSTFMQKLELLQH